MLAPDLITTMIRNAEAFPDKNYIRLIGQRETSTLTFGEHFRQASNVASALKGRFDGGVCLVFLPQGLEMVSAFFGAMLGGLTPSFMPLPSPKQHADVYWQSHRALLERIEPVCIISNARAIGSMIENGLDQLTSFLAIEDLLATDASDFAPQRPDPDAIAFLQHSSGTTGLKKGVALSHRATLRQIQSYAAALNTGPQDALASWLPVYHDMGFIACTVMPLMLGQTVNVMDPFLWTMRPHLILDMIEQHRPQFCWMPNFAFDHVARAAATLGRTWDLSSMKAFISCSEPCKVPTFERFARALEPSGITQSHLQVCYAMAETVFAVSQTRAGEPAAARQFDADALEAGTVAVEVPDKGVPLLSNGPVIDGLTVSIRRDGEIFPGGHIGEICIEGDFLFDGYYRQPDVTQDRLKDGVYHSRDLGFLLDGELYVLGRVDDLIIVHGKNIFAHEVEAVASAVPGVKPGRSVAFGLDNAASGSRDLIVVAEAVGVPDTDRELIGREIRDRVFDATAVTPTRCVIVDEGWLIKTTSGKISREKNAVKYLGNYVLELVRQR